MNCEQLEKRMTMVSAPRRDRKGHRNRQSHGKGEIVTPSLDGSVRGSEVNGGMRQSQAKGGKEYPPPGRPTSKLVIDQPRYRHTRP